MSPQNLAKTTTMQANVYVYIFVCDPAKSYAITCFIHNMYSAGGGN